MPSLATLVAVLSLGLALVGTYFYFRRSEHGERRRAGRERAGLSVLASLTIALVSLLWLLSMQSHIDDGLLRALRWAAGISFTLSLATLIGRIWHGFRRREGASRLQARARLRDRYKLAQRLSREQWRSGEPINLRTDHQIASRTESLLIATALVIGVPTSLVILVLCVAVNIRNSDQSELMGNTVGFYCLLFAACWTLMYLLTILIVALVQYLRGGSHGVHITTMASDVATWAGLGGAGGVLVGAMIPVLVVSLPSDVTGRLGVTLLDAISPALLLNISAAGVVVGFLVGEVISLSSILGPDENLYAKTLLAPGIFLVLVLGGGLLGLTPGKLAHTISETYQAQGSPAATDLSDPFGVAITDGLDTEEGWRALVTGFDAAGWNGLVDHEVYYLLTFLLVTAVCVVGYAYALHRRAEEAAEEAQAAGAGESGAKKGSAHKR